MTMVLKVEDTNGVPHGSWECGYENQEEIDVALRNAEIALGGHPAEEPKNATVSQNVVVPQRSSPPQKGK